MQVSPSKTRPSGVERYVQWDIRQRLEIVGLDVENTANTNPARHVLLRPVGLRLTGGWDEKDHELEGEEWLRWDRIELLVEQPDKTARCLWDFVALHDASPEDILRFIQKWGLLDFGEDAEYMQTDNEAWRSIGDWYAAIGKARAILLTLIATESDELVSEDVLYVLEEGDTHDYPSVFSHGEQRLGLEDYHNLRMEQRLARWRAERYAGRGLALQRELVSNTLTALDTILPGVAVWDEKGRRVETVAYGVLEIVGARLGTIFSAQQIDVFVCSVCGKLYQPDFVGNQRRPRRGARHLCSQECREDAKRKDNLASWHRNKTKWSANRRSRNPKRHLATIRREEHEQES